MEQQHPVFNIYTRDWLHEVTGYSKGYISRVATGKTRLSRAFIARACFSLQQPKSALFLPNKRHS